MILSLGHWPKIIRGSNQIGIKTSHKFYLQSGFGVCISVQGSHQPLLLLHSYCRGHDHFFRLLSFFSLIIISLGIIKYGCTIHFKTWKIHGFLTGTLYSQTTKMFSPCNFYYCYTANQYHSVFLSRRAEESHKKN